MERTLINKFSNYCLLTLCIFFSPNHVADEEINFGIVVHGGAGVYKDISSERAEAYKEGINKALSKGYEILKSGGNSLEAVTAAVVVLEDLPQFNAGKGSVYTSSETQEMDASLMNGKNGFGGAVASVSKVKNPILLAKAVMENTTHVMLVGQGAEDFAKENGIEMVDPSYFYSQKNLDRVRKLKKDNKLGTVGAVALDKKGNLSSATSTGGRSNKMPGRVGDSPILGAGTWAENGLCAVSGTGHGEYFMRYLIAADVCKRMKYLKIPLLESANKVIENLTNKGGAGGIIAIDSEGNIATPFNTIGMIRGILTNKKPRKILIYKDK
ncbi:MAG: beta-aspartyl-peptidase [Gammaproteobacteria bacterium]|nr:beta-aspartyl-peptidase [Gammaproteobacteria bacterium]|tara:strand:- start:960 stop:1937 length:978 start_codon:yes stop_codon:yes gene_type:complete